MAVIYKYPLEFGIKNIVPEGHILHFGNDANGQTCAWVCHSEDREGRMALYIVGTGHEFNDNDVPLLSFVDGSFVWHLIMDWNID